MEPYIIESKMSVMTYPVKKARNLALVNWGIYVCVCAHTHIFVLNKSKTHPRLPWWFSGKESACQFRRCGFNPWVRKIP